MNSYDDRELARHLKALGAQISVPPAPLRAPSSLTVGRLLAVASALAAVVFAFAVGATIMSLRSLEENSGSVGSVLPLNTSSRATAPSTPAPSPAVSPAEVAAPDVTPRDAIFFPVLKPAPVTPIAAFEGRLVLRDGCLWIERPSPTEFYLALWPAGSRLDQSAGNVSIVDSRGIRLATVGDRLRATGGETRDVSFVVQITDQTPPPACRRGEAYWRAYEVIRLP